MPHSQPDARPTSGPVGARRPRGHVRVAGACVAGLATAALLLVPGAGAATQPSVPTATAAAFNVDTSLYAFKTLPTFLPEKTALVSKTSAASTNAVFLASKRNVENWQTGPMILDQNAKLLWYKPADGTDMVTDVRPQTYAGKPVVTWWQGESFRGYGEGQGEIYDTSYQHVATVKAGKGREMDLHEFNITPQGTALIIAYQKGKSDLRKAPGGTAGKRLIQNNYVQEVDIKTGKVLMEWNGAKDVPYSESFNTVPKDKTIPYDWMHLNSVNVTTDGNLVVSARATHTYYKINRKTGRLIWKMGGKNSDFKMGKGSQTFFQHDVHQLSKTVWSAYDNAADDVPRRGAKAIHSRGVLLTVNEKKRTVTLKRAFAHPKRLLGVSQGNMQPLAGGHAFVGWGGDNQYLTEFDAKGKVVWDARLESTKTDTYRAYRGDWVGTPTDRPLLDARSAAGNVTVSMSWNGATQVATWRVLGGTSPDDLKELGSVPWKDLETASTFATPVTKLQVEALDKDGRVLATSTLVDVHA